MAYSAPVVVWFKELNKEDLRLVGQKGIILAELESAGVNIVPGFIVTSKAYFKFLRENNLEVKLKHLLSTVNYEDPRSILQVSKHIKKLITNSPMPIELAKTIVKNYQKIGGIINEPSVILTPTSTDKVHLKDTVELIAKGDTHLLEKVKLAWADLHSEHSIADVRHIGVRGIAVIIQKQIVPEISGILYTIDPTNGNKDMIVIDHKLTKSHKKEINRISKKFPDTKNKMFSELVKIGQDIEKQFYFPQEIKWIYFKNKIYVMELKHISTLYMKVNPVSKTFSGVLTKAPENKFSDDKVLTATKLYLNWTNGKIDKSTLVNIDGISPFQSEQIIKSFGIHPKKILKDGKQHIFTEKLSENLANICKELDPRPVFYKFSELTSIDYRNLSGGKDYEPVEGNPLLGFGGSYRHIKDRSLLDIEVNAVKKVREIYRLHNLHIILPLTRTVEELAQFKNVLHGLGLKRSINFKIWMSIEVPSNIIMLEKFIDEGIDGVCIDLSDLTMFMLGVDKDNSELVHEFNELNPTVLWAIEHVIRTASKKGVTSSAYGDALSNHSELVKRIVKLGVTSMSVSQENIEHTKKLIHHFEKENIRNGKS